jgi:hypothetical protein
MKIDLSDLNESYHSATVGFAGALPNGIYKARLIDAEVGLSKNDNRQIKWLFEAETPSGKLGTTMKFSPLMEKVVGYLKSDLELLGIYLNDLNKIHDVLPLLAGAVIVIEVEDDLSTGSHKVDFLKKVSGPDF